jgi:outer membrane putative beta-barrel porin/alpha-amylase
MRAVSCIMAVTISLAYPLASCVAFAETSDPSTVKQSAKVRKSTASPDKKKPNKNQYWLLNPTPPGAMRTFNTDRPTKANIPYTVDAGHFQYESDLVSFTHQVVGSTRVNTILVPNPTFKVGVTNNVDLEVNVPFAGVHTFGSTSAPSNSLWGISDTLARAKINLWGNDGGDSAAALIPFVKAPSAPFGIGNGAVEEGLIAPLALSLPNSFTLLLVPEVDALKNSADNGRHGNFVLDVNLSREMIKNVTAYVELWSDYSDDPLRKTTQLSFDIAVSWIVIPNVQLDVGANFGLTSATPALQVYAGLSQRF